MKVREGEQMCEGGGKGHSEEGEEGGGWRGVRQSDGE